MFTGIIKGLGKISEHKKVGECIRLGVELPSSLLPELTLGGSIAIDGTCLTLVSFEGSKVFFDVIHETLTKTTLGSYKFGQQVNVERAAKFGEEIGGHLLSGHVWGTAEIIKIEKNVYTFQCEKKAIKYFFPKGYIALDGISLTLVEVDKQYGSFSVHLIPETLKRTTLGWKKEKEKVNFEIDSATQAIVDTSEAFFKERT